MSPVYRTHNFFCLPKWSNPLLSTCPFIQSSDLPCSFFPFPHINPFRTISSSGRDNQLTTHFPSVFLEKMIVIDKLLSLNYNSPKLWKGSDILQPIIQLHNIQKVFRTTIRREGRFGTLHSLFSPQYREITSVKDVSFSIQKGESVAYLGPNGAGKSTTIKMLTGILEPSGGQILVGGMVPHKNRKENSYHIGVVFGQRSQLLYDLPVKDSFDLLRYMYGIPLAQYRRNLDEFTSILGVEHLLNRPVRTFSLGERMRCELIASLLHEPDILFLDEPTIGLDVIAKERIRTFIEHLNREKGVTLLLTTHDLHDIERLCSRTIIIDKGRVIYDGSLKYIKERFSTERKIRAVMPDTASANQVARDWEKNPNLIVTVTENTIQISYDQRVTDTSELLRTLLSKANPSDLTMQDENIEALIRRIYQEGIDSIENTPLNLALGGR
jgi:ABC-2 type transport system ATP-binding protein